MYIPGYRIIRKINHGGMSTVYLAIQESMGRVVALKVMSPALNGDPTFSERFQREANIVGQLSHPNIVSIYDIGRHNKLNYIAMDYLPGGSIHDKMLGGFSANDALEILREMASALDHAHDKGYIHRDIKPENILFRDGGSAVLTDFGVALARNNGGRSTHAGTVVGTPHYMSPEQTRGKLSDGRSDLYSLGVVFYEMLTGAVPYQGDEAVAIALKHLASPLPKLPPQHRRYQEILDKLLDKEPDKRYQTGRDLVVDIEMLQLKMREFGGHDTEHDSDNLGQQLHTLTQTVWLRFATSVSDVCRRGYNAVRRVRFSRQRGFYQIPPETTALSDFPTQQNTLVATRLQNAVAKQQKFYWLSGIFNRHPRAIIAGSTAVLLAALLLLLTGNSPDEPTPPALASHSGAASSGAAHTAVASSAKPQAHSSSSIAAASRPLEPAAPTTASSQLNPRVAAVSSRTGTRAVALADPRVMFPVINQEPVSEPLGKPLNTDNSRQPEPQQAADRLSSSSQSSAASRSSSPQQSSSSAPSRFALSVPTTPSNARVRIMNIREKYTPGMRLTPGRYQIEVTAPGYRKYLRWTTLKQQDLVKPVTLTEQRAVGSVFYSKLASGGNGPAMVVVPAGSYRMGGPSANSQPIHKVTINRRFAVSQHEVTFNEYERFAKRENMPLPGDNRWGRGERPVVNVSWEEADKYAQWLSKQTNLRYRLPSEAEWEYVAKSGKQRDYPWGNNMKNAAGNANCRRYCDSDFIGFFSSKTAPVGSFNRNEFGTYDMAGNVAEWVADCYRDNYQDADSSASAHQPQECAERVIRGGSLKSDAADTNTYARRHHPQHTYHEDVGFRLVAELP
jgi:serine/threonine-protein kinase PpkA